MSDAVHDLLVRVLRQPAEAVKLAPAQWDLLLRQARAAGLTARLAWRLQCEDLSAAVPSAPAAHLQAATRYAQAQHTEVEREVQHVRHALRDLGVPIVLLKGAAYLKAGLPATHGRLFSDTDIMVPRQRLGEVEAALLMHGWATTHHSAYDQRYYRQWMHELPPLVHLRRQTALDVHHAIAPLTARFCIDSAALFAAALPLPDTPGCQVLAPADMVLHSMLHLLVNDELSHALRDLSDLDLLLRHFGADTGFWDRLMARADELGVARLLYYALHFVEAVLHTPVPAAVAARVAHAAPPAALRWAMEAMLRRAFRPPHASAADRWSGPALFLLYLRAHWLRMPPGLLLRHLTVKALRLHREPDKTAAA